MDINNDVQNYFQFVFNFCIVTTLFYNLVLILLLIKAFFSVQCRPPVFYRHRQHFPSVPDCKLLEITGKELDSNPGNSAWESSALTTGLTLLIYYYSLFLAHRPLSAYIII